MSPAREHIRYVRLGHARHELDTGDVLLFRPPPMRGRRLSPHAWMQRLITLGGRSPYCHAGMVVFVLGEPCVIESVESAGGVRIDSLRRRLCTESGAVDVFRPDRGRYREFDALGSAKVFAALLGRRYDWRGVAKSALLHLPWLRRLVDPYVDTVTASSGRPFYCSAAVAYSQRVGGGVDPVDELGDGFTEPGDLARSTLNRYLLTLTSDDDPRGQGAGQTNGGGG